MGRWQPDARGRLEKAAMELFVEHGYAGTTVEEIAARAGLTERTFFRYFADKREVLFSGSKELEENIVRAIESAPKEAGPLEAVATAFTAAGAALQEARDLRYVRARYALVKEHAEIYEREHMKLASLAVAVAKALRARGVSELTATIAGDAGVTAFRIGFDRWLASKKPSDFATHIREAVDALASLAAEGSAANPRRRRRT